MILIQFGLRGILLVLSFYGYLQFISKKIRIELAIPFLFGTIGTVMFLAGMLNMLQETTFLILGAGLYLAYRSARKKESPFSLLSPGTVFFLIGSAVLLYFIYGTKFNLYDDFSHWGTAARVLARYDRFPNATNANISFTSYPLGTASFIYYITKVLGISPEWLQLYAQAILMLGMVMSLFAFASGLWASIAAAGISVFLMVSNTPLVSLLVDTLLPLTAIAAFSLCLYYRDGLSQKIWYLLPYSIFLISIKNSGIIFTVFLYLYIAYRLWKTGSSFFPLLIHVLLTAAVLFFWQKHVKLVYADGMMGRHSLSLSYCMSIFSIKSFADILFTIRHFAANTFSLSNTFFYLIGLGLLCLLLCKYFLKINISIMKEMFLFSLLFYGIYQIGLLGMYLFNMPPDTDPLPSFGRYHDTMIIFAAGIFCACLLWVISQAKGSRVLPVLLATVSIAIAFCTIDPHMGYYTRSVYPGDDRYAMDTLIEKYGIERDRRYFILVSDDRQDSGYLKFMAQYLLNPQDLQICPPAGMETWLEDHCLKHYDYFILFEQTPETLSFFEETFQTSDEVLCTLEY